MVAFTVGQYAITDSAGTGDEPGKFLFKVGFHYTEGFS